MRYFYSSSIRRFLIAFMTLFGDIYVRRYDDSGIKTPDHYREIKVPFKFGPMSKYFQRRTEDATGQRYYVQLPTMAITLTSFRFNAARSRSSKRRRYLLPPDQYASPETLLTDMAPSPWDIGFKVDVKTESFQDFLQIAEQILPWFNPSITVHVKEFESVNLDRNIKVTLDGMSPDFTEVIEEDGKRYVSGSFDFTAEAWLYKPLRTSGNIIKVIHTHYGFDPDFNVDGENFVSKGMTLAEIEDIEIEGTMSRGALPDKTNPLISAEEAEPLGYVNKMEQDGPPQHIPFKTEVEPDGSPAVGMKPEDPQVLTSEE